MMGDTHSDDGEGIVTPTDCDAACPGCDVVGIPEGGESAKENSLPVRFRCIANSCEVVGYWETADGRKNVTKREAGR